MRQTTIKGSGGFATTLAVLGAVLAAGLAHTSAYAGPVQDRIALVGRYEARFPNLKLDDYVNGVYALNPQMRAEWEQIMVFPPYLPGLQEGKKLFHTKFKNGKSYADCFPNGGIGIANTYPRWDAKRGEVMTLALAVNLCRKANSEKPLRYGKGKLAEILAYMADTAKGKKIHVVVPENDPRALEAYEHGKEFYYARRGQLNFSCASCHVQYAGKRIRNNTLSPLLGQATHWPTYRLKWGALGTLQRRFRGCNKQVRAKPFPFQSREYRDLQYFLTYMSNGLPEIGPTVRQ